MKTIDQVLSHYFSYKPELNPDREKLIQAYYGQTERREDPCFRTIDNDEYQIHDHCDIFIDSGKKGNTLALYSSDVFIGPDENAPRAKYPIHIFPDNAYCYYGVKLNILAMLSEVHITNLVLFYDDGQSRNFRTKEITAQIILDHHNNHYREIPEAVVVPNPMIGTNFHLFQ